MHQKALISIILILVILFSCRNRSGPVNKDKESLSEQPVPAVGENSGNHGILSGTGPGEPVTDIEGNEYKTIRIGSQTWFLKNLKTATYNNGTPIPLVTDSTAWAGLSTPGYCWYDNDISSFKPTYGALYNGYTVNTGRLCPKDWHVPGDAEWTILTNYLGGEGSAGGKLKEKGTSFWVGPNTGATNESGFTALPGGLRYHDGSFHDFGFSGYWWTSTGLSQERSFFRYLDYEYSNIFRFDNLNRIGFSVRCVRDY
jgi:uncharacterized protein (TIGR02145 family)